MPYQSQVFKVKEFYAFFKANNADENGIIQWYGQDFLARVEMSLMTFLGLDEGEEPMEPYAISAVKTFATKFMNEVRRYISVKHESNGQGQVSNTFFLFLGYV